MALAGCATEVAEVVMDKEEPKRLFMLDWLWRMVARHIGTRAVGARGGARCSTGEETGRDLQSLAQSDCLDCSIGTLPRFSITVLAIEL